MIDMKVHNKENRERKGKKTKDVMATVHEKQKKMKAKRKNKKEKVKNMDEIEEGADCEVPRSKKKTIASVDSSKSKKVKFSDEVEFFPASDSPESSSKSGLVQGKRFSAEENELIKKAVSDYIEANLLGEEGLDMVLNCKSHPRVRGCWKEIGTALPWRPRLSIYQRAHRLFERGERKWTVDEIEFIRKSYKEHGPKWRMMADELGKNQHHLRQAFQRYKFGNLKTGKWSQHEYQTLFELVNKDLMMGIFEEKKSRHGMLKDNIKWEMISDELGSRHNMACCLKWYNQLTSPMVAEGNWADSDDYRLLMVLLELDASCEDEVEWDYLLEHRSGDLCRKRWLQMVRHLGEHGNKSFSEQIEVLSERYCPDLADVREAFDARPIVDISMT